MKKLYTFFPLALILCFMVSCQDKADNEYKGTILIEFSRGSSIFTLKSKPIFRWDPRKQIVASLEAAGYKVISKKRKQHNLAIKINYQEGPVHITRQPIHGIKAIGFILEDSTGAVLLKENWNPIDRGDVEEGLIRSFAANLPNLISERLEAEDEFSFLNGLIQREGFNMNRFRRLVQLKDPRTSEALVPHLRACGTQNRWEVRWALERLEFEPQTAWEKAAFDMVTLDRPGTYTSGFKFRKSSGADLIAKHGITAIELFLEDLKCTGRNYETAGHARSALSNLAKWRWWKSKGTFDQRWNEFTVASLSDALKAAHEDSAKLAAMDERYIDMMIEVLGDIATYQTTELLQAYVSNPQWAKAANEAVKKIARRSGKWTTIDLYYNERQVETEYEVMERSTSRGPFPDSDKQIIQKYKEKAKQKGANAVIIEGVYPDRRIYLHEGDKKVRIIDVTFIKYKILS